MGLDITAYSHLEHIGIHAIDPELNEGELGPWCYYENHVQAMAYDTFPQSFRGIPVLGSERGHSGAGLIVGGCYEHTDKTNTLRFQAGSYGGYNAWRSNLARQFNPAPDPDGPFYELIWFADNEGCIGPEAAADLVADFRAHAAAYSPPTDAYWYREKYDDWTRAFELAADGGLVDFH